MVVQDKLYGVLCLSNPSRRPAAARGVFALVAQMGAFSFHNSATVNEVVEDAQLDKLTQVLNKAAIRKSLEKELKESARKGCRMSILLFDIDNFKNYNDTNGHMPGDELLQQLAQLISRSTRDYDRLGRFGGEEFLLILPETDAHGAAIVAEKVRLAIQNEPFAHREKQPLGYVSISGGVATFPENGRDADTMLKLADEALYSGKEAGRNRVMQARRLAIATDLHGRVKV